jgi:hypothetical protein
MLHRVLLSVQRGDSFCGRFKPSNTLVGGAGQFSFEGPLLYLAREPGLGNHY